MGVSRDTFHRYQELVESGDVDSLMSRSRRVPNLKNRVDEACGEIETHHLSSHDTFYVGNLRGVGRIYQQTFVDTYSKVAFDKLYTTKTPITSVGLLSDRGTEFCGKVEHHGLPALPSDK